jgi:hypothetical protein
MRHALLAVCLACALFLACDGDGGHPGPASPTAELSDNLSPTVGGVEAMRRYIQEVGLDGRRGTLTDPLDCAEAATADGVRGDFCIAQAASVYAPGLVVLFIGEPESYQEKAWRARVDRTEDGWAVRDVTLHEED